MKSKRKLAFLLAFVLSLGGLFIAPAIAGATAITPHGCAYGVAGCASWQVAGVGVTSTIRPSSGCDSPGAFCAGDTPATNPQLVHEPVGDSITFQVALAVTTGNTATGTVAAEAFTSPDCSLSSEVGYWASVILNDSSVNGLVIAPITGPTLPAGTYYFRGSFTDNLGNRTAYGTCGLNGGPSDIVFAEPFFVASAISDTAITVTWSNAPTYSVSRDGVDASGTGYFTHDVVGDPSSGSFTFLNLIPNTTYHFTLDSTTCFTGQPCGSDLFATATTSWSITAAASSSSTVVVTWCCQEAAVTLSRDGTDANGTGPWSTVVQYAPGGPYSYTFANLLPDTIYHFTLTIPPISPGCVAFAPPCTVTLTATATTAALPAPPPPVVTPPPPVSTPAPPTTPAPPVTTSPTTTNGHGYWLVGSDGGIFSFGSAQFYGSTGALRLNRPVVGITPTTDRGGYWLDASDGGIFSFGDAGFFGSIPGLGIAPAGSGLPHSLSAPIVGMVPTADGNGYFMVGADGGVFTFGDAHFEGSCPAIGGCPGGAAVSVIPDSTGNGYWLVTVGGGVTPFGDAPDLGSVAAAPVVSAARSFDGGGYYLLYSNGVVYAFGDAVNYGSANGQVGGFNPAATIFTTADGGGYWIVSSNGSVITEGNAPYDGGANNLHLNGSIIAGTGW